MSDRRFEGKMASIFLILTSPFLLSGIYMDLLPAGITGMGRASTAFIVHMVFQAVAQLVVVATLFKAKNPAATLFVLSVLAPDLCGAVGGIAFTEKMLAAAVGELAGILVAFMLFTIAVASLPQSSEKPAESGNAPQPQNSLEAEKDEKVKQVIANRAGREPAQIIGQITRIEEEYRGKK